MPKKLEEKLRAEAKAHGLNKQAQDAYVYGTMNKIGVMHGNKVVHHSSVQPRHKGKFR